MSEGIYPEDYEDPSFEGERLCSVIAALRAENERLRGLLRDTASVAITMLYDSHKADVLAEFKVPELEAVVDASKHLQSHRAEHVYRCAWDAALSQQAEPAKEVQ